MVRLTAGDNWLFRPRPRINYPTTDSNERRAHLVPEMDRDSCFSWISLFVCNVTPFRVGSWNDSYLYLLPLCIGQPKLFASTLQTLCLTSCRVRPWNCATTCTIPPFRVASTIVFEKVNKTFGSWNNWVFSKGPDFKTFYVVNIKLQLLQEAFKNLWLWNSVWNHVKWEKKHRKGRGENKRRPLFLFT